MSGQHTQGRLVALKVSDGFSLFDEKWNRVADFPTFDPENPRRLSACWNAFDKQATGYAEMVVRLGGVESLLSGKEKIIADKIVELAAARALLNEVLSEHDARIEVVKNDGDYPVPNPFAERIRAFLKGQP